MSGWDYGRLRSFAEELALAAEDLVTAVDPVDQAECDLQSVDRCTRRCEQVVRTIKTLLNRERKSRA
jgi:hypothetical protein